MEQRQILAYILIAPIVLMVIAAGLFLLHGRREKKRQRRQRNRPIRIAVEE